MNTLRNILKSILFLILGFLGMLAVVWLLANHTQLGSTHPRVTVELKVNTTPGQLELMETFLVEELQSKYELPAHEAAWWAEQIAWASYRWEVPDTILVSLIAVESSFRTEAVSHMGAVGPAQVIPEVWTGHLPVGLDLGAPEENIEAGAWILWHYHTECGGWRCALAAYNVGITNYRLGKQKDAQDRYLAKVRTQLALLEQMPVEI